MVVSIKVSFDNMPQKNQTPKLNECGHYDILRYKEFVSQLSTQDKLSTPRIFLSFQYLSFSSLLLAINVLGYHSSQCSQGMGVWLPVK